ncbi:MAG: hypothetical protein P8J14_04350 [Emcibacteraceae bacterium]|nr:hypothetical protein [Emcibacteraceae bacterium]
MFTYGWYWVAYGWQYLQDTPRGSWGWTWILFTILVILIQRRNGVAAVGANVIETIMSRVKTVLPHIVGLLLALAVGLTAFSLQLGGFIVNEYVQGAVVVVSNSLLTSIFVGALDDATQ